MGRVTAEPVSEVAAVHWMSAALHSIHAQVVDVTVVRSSEIGQHRLTLEAWIPGHFQSLDEGIYLCVAMTSTLSKAETCSNQEQGKS